MNDLAIQSERIFIFQQALLGEVITLKTLLKHGTENDMTTIMTRTPARQTSNVDTTLR